MNACWTALIVLAIVAAREGNALADERIPLGTRDLALLKASEVPTDGPGLIKFLRQRTPADADLTRIDTLIRQLGDEDFQVREQATRDLIAVGQAAAGALERAVHAGETDVEVSHRARRCLAAIQPREHIPILAASVRLLIERQPAGTLEVLLAFLPAAGDEALQALITSGIIKLGVSNGQAHRSLVAAIQDAVPARRIAAVTALIQVEGTRHREAIRQLAADADPSVRLQVAHVLAGVKDRAAVSALLSLLSDGPLPLAWQAEELLCCLAGGHPPAQWLSDEPSRKKCRVAWEAWWQANQAKVDLGRWNANDRQIGLTMICETNLPDGNGRVWECAADGKPRWQVRIRHPLDVQPMPDGRFLLADCRGCQVVEMDRQGKTLWGKVLQNRLLVEPVSCQRLANGNTFIATHTALLEVTQAGDIVYSYARGKYIFNAQKLPNGHLLYIHSGGYLVELDGNGSQVRTIPVGDTQDWADLQPLAGGRFLIAQYAGNRVREIDGTGKVFWEHEVETPTSASRLRNGNTLITSAHGKYVVEVDSTGKEVWKLPTEGTPFRARRR